MLKAQVSSEFFVFVGLSLLIALAFELSSLQQLNEFRLQKENEAVKDIALKLQKELLLAANVEDGYVRVFDVPNKLENIDYSIFMTNISITVNSSRALYIVAIPNALGNISKGVNKINKTGGVIHINNIKQFIFADFNSCQNAQNGGLCGGLDLAYGAGYQAACCSEHGLCC